MFILLSATCFAGSTYETFNINIAANNYLLCKVTIK